MGSSASTPKPSLVFLGGSCGDNTYREDIAIPAFKKANIKYYNPKVLPGEWKESMIAEENTAKNNATILLFIIDGQTRGIMSMLEVVQYITSGRHVVLCVDDVVNYPEDEKKDINRGRSYLRNLADEYKVYRFEKVQEAVLHIVNISKI